MRQPRAPSISNRGELRSRQRAWANVGWRVGVTACSGRPSTLDGATWGKQPYGGGDSVEMPAVVTGGGEGG